MARRRRRRRRRRGSSDSLKRAAAIGLVVALVAVAAWYVAARPAEGGGPYAACVIVIDRTDSSSDPGTIDAYRLAARQAIDGCVERSADLTIFSFDQSNAKLVVANSEPYRLYVPASKDPAQIARSQPELEATIAEARRAVDDILSRTAPPDRGSDILSALKSAAEGARVLASRDGVDTAFLVLVTDGVQLGSDISFAEMTDPDTDLVSTLVARAEALGQIPDLDGVSVNFVGVRSGRTADGQQIPEWFEARAEASWKTIVDRGGGRMCVYAASVPSLPVEC